MRRLPSRWQPSLTFRRCTSAGAGKQAAAHFPTARCSILFKNKLSNISGISAHPVSGLARERSNTTPAYGNEVVTIGGSGFGIMAIIVATDRHWITRDTAVKHLLKEVNFLLKANSYHGIFPHWLNGATGITIPFSRKDDGADIVETSYLFEGLLCARQYFNQQNPLENAIEK